MSKFFFVNFTITGVKKVVSYIEDFVTQGFVISRFHGISFCFWLALLGEKDRFGLFKGKSVCWHTNLKTVFFQAKCNVDLVYELINEIKQASSLARSHGNQQAALSFKEFAQMLSENVQVLDQYPECTLQQSANFPDSSAPAKAAQVNNVVFLRIHSIMLCSLRGSPRIRKFKSVGFWNPRLGFWIPGTRSCIPCQWKLILDSNV